MIYNDCLHYDLIPFLAKGLGIKKFLELGCHEGELLRRMVTAGIPTIVGVDYEHKPTIEGAITYLLNTDEFFTDEVQKFQPFDMIFIDCNHTESAVERDFKYSIKAIEENGLILLHDTLPIDEDCTRPDRCGTAYLFAERLRSNDEYESMTLPFSPGLTMVRKRTKQVPW